MFWDVHSHVVPSGDDGAKTVDEGVALCRSAAEHGTSVLFATPHVWPHLELTDEREQRVRAAHARMADEAATFGLDLRLGFELTPRPGLLDEDPARYRLAELPAVLMEVPFHGSLSLARALGEHVETSGLVPIVAHPERAEATFDDPTTVVGFHERGWLLQINATSVLGYHGRDAEAAAWRLIEEDVCDLVGSDGHRSARPAHLDEAFRRVEARLGEGARRLFDGSALRRLAARDRVDLAERR